MEENRRADRTAVEKNRKEYLAAALKRDRITKTNAEATSNENGFRTNSSIDGTNTTE